MAQVDQGHVLITLDTPSLTRDENISVGENVPHLTPIDPHGIATTPTSESGMSLALLIFPRKLIGIVKCQHVGVWLNMHLPYMNSLP